MANIVTRNIPNTITCLNLISGCVAIILAFKGIETIGALPAWQWASIAIGCAAVFDFLDGLAARTLKAYSKIGAELDSLSDLVSFGVAPAMLILNLILAQTPGDILAYLVLIYPALGAIRLARYNVTDQGTTVFHGLPIPAAAIFLIGLAGWITTYTYPTTPVVVCVVILAALAMVGRFSMFSLKFHNLAVHRNLRRYVLIASLPVFVYIYGISGLAWTIIFYLLLSLLSQSRNN